MQKHMPQLLSVMTPFPYYVEAEKPVTEAQALMESHDIRHLPVMINEAIDSIISDADIKRAQLIGHRNSPEEELLVGDICSPRAWFADVSDPLDQILALMTEKHVNVVIVLKDGALAGIFTDSDACKVLLDLLRDTYKEPQNDSAA